MKVVEGQFEGCQIVFPRGSPAGVRLALPMYLLGAIPLLALLLTASAFGQATAHDYYKELYDAGGLDRMVARYVCFQDDSKAENFFIFAESKYLLQYMTENHTLNKLSKSQQNNLKKGFLGMRGYTKGVPWKDEMYFDKDGDSWVTDKFPLGNTGVSGIVRFTMNPQTLRYKYAVEYAGATKEHGSFGRCEEIPAGVKQH